MFEFLKIAGNLTHPIGLAAFSIGILLLVLRLKKRIPPQFWVVITILVIVPVALSVYVQLTAISAEKQKDLNHRIYRVRITVLNLQKTPVEDAIVWSSIGGEPKKVAGGWQFDIPEASKPKDSSLTIFASLPGRYLRGENKLVLSDDYTPAVSIELASESSAQVRGIVIDVAGKALSGAKVHIVGYDSEAVETGQEGGFVLPAHAAADQQVLLHVEKAGYSAVQQWHPAGDFPASITLERR